MPGTPLVIAHVSEHASPLASDIGSTDAGGQNVYVRALATAQAARGHKVTVYTRRTAAHQAATAALAPGAQVAHVPAGPARELPKEDLAPFMGDFGDQLALAWRDQPPDIVHTHYWMSGVAALAGTRRTPIPVVATFHALAADRIANRTASEAQLAGLEISSAERERERVGVERAVAQAADAVIALTTAEAAYLTGPAAGVSPARVTVIPVGVDTALFTPDGPVLDRGAPARLVAVSRLVERKGIRTVIEAIASLPGCELLIAGGPDPGQVGSDPVIRTLRDHARLHGVSGRVRFLGRVPHADVPALLRSADAFVCAPRYEPFGTAALEAAACGVPVVATAVGGLREHVIDGVTGLLVAPPAPALPDVTSTCAQDLASATAKLLADPARRAQLGSAGARNAARYSWPRIAGQILDAYQHVLRT